MDLAGLGNFRKNCLNQVAGLSFIIFFLADGVERQIVPRIISQVGGPGWFLEYVKALF